MVPKNFHTKPCVFTAPDAHSAYLQVFTSWKLPKTFIPIDHTTTPTPPHTQERQLCIVVKYRNIYRAFFSFSFFKSVLTTYGNIHHSTHTPSRAHNKNQLQPLSCLDKEASPRRSLERLNGVLLDALIKEVITEMITNIYIYQRSQWTLWCTEHRITQLKKKKLKWKHWGYPPTPTPTHTCMHACSHTRTWINV